MIFFKNTLWVKRIAILVSFVIVSLILWNTYVFFQKFKQEERAKMENYAAAIEELATANEDASVTLTLKIIEQTKNIPLILVHQNGTIKEFYNLDSIKSLDPIFLKKELRRMKKENRPIEVKYLGVTEYVYYRDSDLLNKLTYYPLALILILVLFLSVI